MPDLTVKENLQPSLLDRLADDEPGKKNESRDKRVLTIKQLRQSVIRDLAWLLNSNNHELFDDMQDYPYARKSVLNYGMPDLSGKILSGMEVIELESMMRNVICTFEPRIIRNTLKVKVSKTEDMSPNSLGFDIEGDLWAQPVPLHLFLKTEIDMEAGNVKVEQRG